MTASLLSAAEVRLGRQRAPQYETGDHLVPYLRSANIADGTLDLSDVKSMNFSPAEQAVFTLRAGDVLVTEGSGSRDTVGASAVWSGELSGSVCFQNTLLRLRPRAGISDGRYLAWWARHAHSSGLMAAVASGASILHLGAENLRRLPITLPVLDEQRRIADFLDDQVTRIDLIIAARERQVSLIDQRRRSRTEQLIAGDSVRMLPLRRRVIDVCVGIVVQPAALYVDDTELGVPAMRGTDVREGWINVTSPVRISMTGHRANPRSALRCGDVVVVRTGAAGTAAVVTAETEGWNCIDLVVVRTGADMLPEFVEIVLNHYANQARIGAASAGSIQAHFGVGALRELLVPDLSLRHQRAITGEATESRSQATLAQATMNHQIRLLEERRRALITAAVTGEFDVSTASTCAAAAVIG